MTDQLGLGAYTDESLKYGGQFAALGLKSREGQKPQGLLGLKQKQKQTPPQAPKQDADAAQQAAARAKLEDARMRLFTPVEQGGALLTTASKPRMVDMGNGTLVGAPIPEGYSWMNVPKAVLDKITLKLPPGVKPTGFAADAMDETQHNMVAWFGQQKGLERQQEADAMAAQQAQQQASPDANKP